MGRDWKQWEGRIVNSFPLRQYLGGSDRSAVFLTERRGRDPQRAAIKLIAVNPANTANQLAQWEFAAKLSHPHLLRLFETGSCQLDSVVLLYVVMEYAEENLGQILPQRPLTPEEARDLLEPALDALAFIHGKGLVHGRLKPSNVMAAQDQLKLSSDSLMKAGEPVAGSARASAYDAPEIASGKILPASDSWSLGVTLMEALTQRLPAREIGMGEPMPETVPAPFMGIAHCCLRRDPERRCSAADIAARLRSNSSSPLSMAQGPSTLRIPAAAGKWRYILPVAVVVLVAAALLFGPKLVNSRPESQPASVSSENPATPSAETSSGTSSARANAPAKLEAAPSATATKPSARKSGNTNLANANSANANAKASSAATRPAAPANAGSTAAPTEGPATISGQVVQQPMPAVSKSARDTIHGTIKVRVKVAVDAAGNVQNATFATVGPSKYFARQAMQAAQQWKFVPAQGQDPRTWIVQFGFKRSGTDAALESAKP